MTSYITLSHIQVQSANCVAGVTYGFPSITSFLGFVRVLSRKLYKTHGVTLDGCAVIAHQYQLLTYKTDDYSDHFFTQTKNPAAGQYQQKYIGTTPPVIEEGKMHLNVSLLVECLGFSGNYEDKLALERHIKTLCLTHRIAGGVITDIKDVIYENIENDSEFYQCQRRLMPGFILMDRSQDLTDYYAELKQDNPDFEMLEAWLDFCSIQYQAESQLDEGEELTNKSKAKWNLQRKPKPGYLIPLMTGYQAISEVYPAGTVRNTRDNKTPFCFVEAIYGIGEWLSPHRLTSLESAIWRYHYEDERYYLCKQETVNINNELEQSNDIEDIFFQE